MCERQSSELLDPNLLKDFVSVFASRRDLFSLQLANGSYVSVQRELDQNLVVAHLKGYITIGTYALDQAGWSKWICFDADDDERWQQLRNLAKTLDIQGVCSYLERSRRGGHLWLFPLTIPGFQTRRFAKQLLVEHKLEGVEIYPKQDKPVTGPGSCVRLPLGIHRLTGKRYHFINPDGSPLAATIREQIQLLAAPKLVPQAFIDDVLSHAPVSKIVSPTPRFKPKPDEIAGETPSERIKNRMSVFEFVSQYIELDPQGKGYCPFHEDEHKSFQVNDEGNFWNCYAGCGGGSIIDFWMKWRKLQGKDDRFKATVKDLAKMLL